MKDRNRYRFIIQGNICLVRICSGAIWASAGPLLPLIMAAYSINRGTVGWYASIGPLAITLLAAPLGILGTRYSLKKTFAVGAILQAAGLLTPFCNSYIPLLLTRISFALGTGITFPLIPAIASEWFTPKELPLVNGVTMSFNSLGNTLAYFATIPIATALSWQAPIVIYGAMALTTGIAWIILGKDQKKDRAEQEAIRAEAEQSKPETSLRQVLTQRSSILLMLATLGSWGLGNSIGSWLPTYYHQVFNMSLAQASSITGIVTVVGIGGCIIVGFLPLRLGRRKPFLIIPGACLGISALSAVLFNNTAVIYISIICFGLLSNMVGPSLFTIPFELHKSTRAASYVTFLMLLGGNFGNFIGPLFVGYLADMTGSYLPGFIISAAISLSMLMAGLMLPETGPVVRRLGRREPLREAKAKAI